MPGANLFQQAKDAVNRLTNTESQQNKGTSMQEKQAAQNAIQAAYQDSTPEEREQLQQLEQHLKQENHLQS